MAAVKGSKQFTMVVRRSRPVLEFVLTVLALVAVGILVAASHRYGKETGMELKAVVANEGEFLQKQLNDSVVMIRRLSQENADLKLGEEVDSIANEEVRRTVESLQQDIADLQEEVRFYKSVLMPNVEEKGLRIERLDVKATADPRKIRYQLLLTQVVDKHEYIQGRVEMQIVGKRNNEEARLSFDDVAELDGQPLQFRFRYFQNLDGEITLPDDFTPVEVMVIANSTGRDSRRLERRFDWHLAEG
jgi:hypothetical protein